MAYLQEALKNLTAQLRLKGGTEATTLTGDLTLTKKSPNFVAYDPGGTSRDLTMLAEDLAEGLFICIYNSADVDGENLVVKDDAGATIVTINRDESAIVACDGSSWFVVLSPAGEVVITDLTISDAGELTIATGAVVATGSHHSIDTEGDVASDDLTTITGLASGKLLFITPENGARTVVIRHGIGANLIATPLGQSIPMADATDWALLFNNGTQSTVLAYSTLTDTPVEATIAAGVLAVNRRVHSVDTEADAATDDVATITGGQVGQEVVLYAENAARSVVLTHTIGADGIQCPKGQNVVLSDTTDYAVLRYDGTQWILISSNTLTDEVSELTIAVGVIAATRIIHNVDTEADAATDDLTTITGGLLGAELTLYPNNAARTVVVRHGVGANLIQCPHGQSIVLAETTDYIKIRNDGTQWIVIGSNVLSDTAVPAVIAVGVLAATARVHAVTAEGTPADDQIDTITGAQAGAVLTIYGAVTAEALTLAHSIGADGIQCPYGQQITLSADTDYAVLRYDGTQWVVIAANVLADVSTELTIAVGVVAAVAKIHSIDTEADAATDDLTTITGGQLGAELTIYPNNAARSVVIAHGIGADLIQTPLGQSIVLADTTDYAKLRYDGTQWTVLASNALTEEAIGVAIVGGTFAVTAALHAVTAQGTPAADQIDTITAGILGQVLTIYGAVTADVLTIAHSIGADGIACPHARNIVLTADTDYAVMRYDGTQWIVIAFNMLAAHYPTLSTTWTMGVMGLWYDDGDGVETNGGGMVGATPTLTNQAAALAKVYDNGTSTFANLAVSGGIAPYTSNWQIFPDVPTDEDAVYFGGAVPFPELGLDMGGVVQASGGAVFTWEYSQGAAAWAAATIRVDGTGTGAAVDGSRSFEADGAITHVPPADWATDTVDGQLGYWLRCRVTTVANIGANLGVTNAEEHSLITPTHGFYCPANGTVTGLRLADGAAALHTTRDVLFILVNFTTGLSTTELTFAQALRNERFTGLSLAVSAGDRLGVICTQDDGGGAEPDNVLFELEVTLT